MSTVPREANMEHIKKLKRSIDADDSEEEEEQPANQSIGNPRCYYHLLQPDRRDDDASSPDSSIDEHEFKSFNVCNKSV